MKIVSLFIFAGFIFLLSIFFNIHPAFAATCGCSPPPETAHGQNWTDNMCFFKPSTPNCPQTAPGGYCDPNGDGSYADADWVKGYYEYKTQCPGNNLTPTRSAPTPTGTYNTTPTPQPTTGGGNNGTTDLNKCTGYDVDAILNKFKNVTNNEQLTENIKKKLIEACGGTGGNNNGQTTTETPYPTGQYPTGTTGDGSLYDWNELINPSSQPNDVSIANSCLQNRSAYESACNALGFSGNLCIAVMAGIDFREDGCRPNGSCKDGVTNIGNPDPDFGYNCSATETKPGSPVRVGSGCGFTNKAHAMRWCTSHLMGKSQTFNGTSIPQNLSQLAYAVAGYNGIPGNTNCRSGVAYSYCPPQFKLADNLYAFNKYMCPKFNNYCNMNLIWCKDGIMCSQPHPFSGQGVLTIARAVAWVLKGGK